VDEHPQALTEWDAWADVRQDATADEVHPERHPPQADGAEKSAGQARVAPEWGAPRQWEPPAAPAEEQSHVSELYRLAVARSEERSCAAREAAERQDAREPPGKRWLKLEEAQQPPESAPRVAVPDVWAAPPVARVATMPAERRPDARE
jgi:hypothetical protein